MRDTRGDGVARELCSGQHRHPVCPFLFCCAQSDVAPCQPECAFSCSENAMRGERGEDKGEAVPDPRPTNIRDTKMCRQRVQHISLCSFCCCCCWHHPGCVHVPTTNRTMSTQIASRKLRLSAQ